MSKTITVEADVRGEPHRIWELWNGPEHMERWMHASDDWECSRATNDVRPGGKLTCTLGAKDGSASFDLVATYSAVEPHERLAYAFEDGRTVVVTFSSVEGGVRIVETFEMEHENSEEAQQEGWQAMLESFKAYAEANAVQA